MHIHTPIFAGLPATYTVLKGLLQTMFTGGTFLPGMLLNTCFTNLLLPRTRAANGVAALREGDAGRGAASSRAREGEWCSARAGRAAAGAAPGNDVGFLLPSQDVSLIRGVQTKHNRATLLRWVLLAAGFHPAANRARHQQVLVMWDHSLGGNRGGFLM